MDNEPAVLEFLTTHSLHETLQGGDESLEGGDTPYIVCYDGREFLINPEILRCFLRSLQAENKLALDESRFKIFTVLYDPCTLEELLS
jgi:hypothetical protein